MILVAVSILGYDLYRELLYRRALARPARGYCAAAAAMALANFAGAGVLAWGPMLLAFSIVVVPSGMAGVRVSQMSGTVPGTLYPGAHFVAPLVEDVALFDTRDQIFTTGVLGGWKERRGECVAQVATARRAGERRTDAGTGDYGALPARSEAAGLHSKQSAASGGEGNCSADRGQRVAGTGSELYGARCFFGEARRRYGRRPRG